MNLCETVQASFQEQVKYSILHESLCCETTRDGTE